MHGIWELDWCDFRTVCELAERFGPGQSVTKSSDRSNFNITHTSRRDRIDRPGVVELYCTIGEQS